MKLYLLYFLMLLGLVHAYQNQSYMVCHLEEEIPVIAKNEKKKEQDQVLFFLISASIGIAVLCLLRTNGFECFEHVQGSERIRYYRSIPRTRINHHHRHHDNWLYDIVSSSYNNTNNNQNKKTVIYNIGNTSNENKKEQECFICRLQEMTHTAAPCGHLVGCVPCLTKIIERTPVNQYSKCPICKTPMEMCIRTYS